MLSELIVCVCVWVCVSQVCVQDWLTSLHSWNSFWGYLMVFADMFTPENTQESLIFPYRIEWPSPKRSPCGGHWAPDPLQSRDAKNLHCAWLWMMEGRGYSVSYPLVHSSHFAHAGRDVHTPLPHSLESNQSRRRRSEGLGEPRSGLDGARRNGWDEAEGVGRMKASPAVMETRLLLLAVRNE